MVLILHIAIPVPLYNHFDYLAPQEISAEKLQPGVRVKVPWRQTELVGILLGVSQKTLVNTKKLKTAIEILDDASLFSNSVFSLIQFAADYYHHPIGEVFATALPTLLRQGRDTQYRQHYSEFEALPEAPLVLTATQALAVKSILEKNENFQPYLLFGVTGSGKTEVYLQAIAEVLRQGKQALILVPEIGLTPQTVMRFQQRFPVIIAVLHSGLSDRERHDGWLQASNGNAKIVIGTRSAIFTPLLSPGIIIIDEEHDLSFKQQEGFRYSARDLAIVRAQLEKIPVVLGSATPSLESFYNMELKRYHLINLPERAGSAVHPTFHLIDLRKQRTQHGLSSALLKRMQQHLNQRGQILVFLNRRGYAPTLLCHHCGWVAMCKRCDIPLTLHQQPLHLQCHHCGTSQIVYKYCPDCQATQLFPLGAGTERVEQALQEHFPGFAMIRVDRDSTRKKGALEDKLATIQQGEPCILIGTQMLAKGHHFPNVTLAVILNSDAGLFSSDFRGAERIAQLILQVAGRAGRVEKPGEVILQTYHPEHPLLKILLSQDYAAFLSAALRERQQACWPPYWSLALIRAEAIKTEIALLFLQDLKKIIADHFSSDIMIFGPVPAPMPKRAGKHRAQLLLQSSNRKALQHTLFSVTGYLTTLKNKQHVRWSIDVDPQEMF